MFLDCQIDGGDFFCGFEALPWVSWWPNMTQKISHLIYLPGIKISFKNNIFLILVKISLRLQVGWQFDKSLQNIIKWDMGFHQVNIFSIIFRFSGDDKRPRGTSNCHWVWEAKSKGALLWNIFWVYVCDKIMWYSISGKFMQCVFVENL